MLLTILANVVQVAPVVPPDPPAPPTPSDSGGRGGGSYTSSRYSYEKSEQEKVKEKQTRNNKFIMEFLKTATDIINNQ